MARLLPVMFVHGFNGDPGDWTRSGFRQHVLAHGRLDPDLVRLFDYGVADDGTYNNRGDVRQVASRLAGAGMTDLDLLTSSVDRLSQDSLACGGPMGVTLIAHSMGGIVSRYYLSRREPDEFGTLYHGRVSRLILIGSPNRGVDALRLTQLAPRDSLPWRIIRLLERLGLAPALPSQVVESWEATLYRRQLWERADLGGGGGNGAGRVLLTDSMVPEQLEPESPFLAALNTNGTMPDAIECHTIYGDIRIRVHVRISDRGPALVDETFSFGDLMVAAYSAMEIPGVQAVPHPFITELCLDLTLRGAECSACAGRAPARGPAELLPDTQHCNLLANPAVQATVLSLLGL